MHHHRNIIFYGAALFLVILGVTAVAAPLVAPYHPTVQNLEQRFKSPGSKHWLGTDNFGRDILSRIIYGSRSALMVGIVAVTIAVAIGMLIGLAAGLAEGYVDNLLMLLMDSLMSFPTILRRYPG